MKASGMRQQIILAMSIIVTFVTAIMAATLPWSSFTLSYINRDGYLPTGSEWVMIGLTTGVSLAVGILTALNLSRRILMPLNSVAEGLQKIEKGDIKVRAIASAHPPDETTSLVDGFNNMAKTFNRLTNDWSTALSHELLTPLSILRGQLQGLAEGIFEPNTSQFQTLLTQVDSLTRLIEDLRVVSLADCGHLTINLQESDLALEIENHVKLVEPRLKASGLSLRLDMQKRFVRCDPVKIQQALAALLDSVREHASPGNVVIQLSSKHEVNYLRVKNDSHGIDEKFAANIFETSQTNKHTRSGIQDRTDLQLAVIRAVAFAHGGSVKRLNRANGGILFELSWPI